MEYVDMNNISNASFPSNMEASRDSRHRPPGDAIRDPNQLSGNVENGTRIDFFPNQTQQSTNVSSFPPYHHQRMVNSTSADDMAETFAVSLANIAAAGAEKSLAKYRRRIQQQQQQQQQTHQHTHMQSTSRGMKRKSRYHEASESNDDAGGADSSTASSDSQSGEGTGPPAVSTSSGEDRSSSGGSGSTTERVTGNEASALHHGIHPTQHLNEERDTHPCVPHLSSIQRLEHEHAKVVAHLSPRSLDGMGRKLKDRLFTDVAEVEPCTLHAPHQETGFHIIRKTFSKFPKHDSSFKSCDDENDEQKHTRKHKSNKGKQQVHITTCDSVPMNSTSIHMCRRKDEDVNGDDSGGSAGSGTEGGYAASSSSNGHEQKQGSCSSPSSEDSSEDSGNEQKNLTKGKFAISGDPTRPMLSKKLETAHSISSEIADFSSSSTSSIVENYPNETYQSRIESPSITSASNSGDPSDEDEDNEEAFTNNDKHPTHITTSETKPCNGTCAVKRMGGKSDKWINLPEDLGVTSKVSSRLLQMAPRPKAAGRMKEREDCAETKPPLISLGCDVMAHVLTFLQPTEILNVLTMPLSRDWLCNYTRQPELWRVLCILEPFKAQVDESDELSDENDFPFNNNSGRKHAFGKFRLLYTSFVRCMKYLVRIKEDAVNGQPPSVVDFGSLDGQNHNISANRNLQYFLSHARGVVGPTTQYAPTSATANTSTSLAVASAVGTTNPPSDEDSSSQSNPPKKRRKKDKAPKTKVRYGHSKLTQRLLGPAANGNVREVELPWSCGIYSIVNWMVAFADVEGIQTMCLKVLPFLLENEQQRITAQRAGLTDIVLRAMVLFPESPQLHTAAFHTIVLLARPLGGQEGMLFHTSMVNSSGIFSSQGSTQGGRNGIAVLLDSMRRFQDDNVLQSMGCWSLVNIALAPAQKEVLVKLGGIEVTAKAMMEHPYDAEVQFRALFALINLVIPSVTTNPPISDGNQQPLGDDDQSEREMLDEMVDQIVHLVVLSMKNFCSNEAILNRACLVLHNLSLTMEYHEAILWTPSCYQMLEWCLGNYRTDQVLQQSAAGTLHRLQTTLSRNDSLRVRFAASIQAQQQRSLEQAHAEAIMLHGRLATQNESSNGMNEEQNMSIQS